MLKCSIQQKGLQMRKLRTAVIGLGRIGWQFHIPKIIENEKFELAAVVDPMKDRLDEAEKEFGTKGFSDYDEMLKSGVDLVVIASPTQFHAEQAIKAFEAGVDVFCDKPITVSLEDADSMISAMNKNKRKLMVYQPHRALSEVTALKEIISMNLIGPVYMIKRAASNYDKRNDWQAFLKNGGGMLSNYGAHFIDQLLYLTGSGSKHISCSLRTIASMGDADDVVKILIETENGIILDVDINMASARQLQPWHILGECGSIVLNKETNSWDVKYFRKEDLPDIAVQSGLAAANRQYGSGVKIQWRNESFPVSDYQPIDFYDKCYEYYALDNEPFVPVVETRELMRTLNECKKDAQRKA